MRWWTLCWAGLFGLYLLLAGEASGEELVAAALTAAAATGSGVLIRRLGGPRAYSARLAWARHAIAPLKALPVDVALVGGVLCRALIGRAAGTLLRQPFDSERDTPLAAARCALVVLGASFAPNTVAVGIAPARLLLHRLAPRPPSPDRAWPL